jgi:hypothetical protein
VRDKYGRGRIDGSVQRSSDDSSWALSDGRAGTPLPGKRSLTESMYPVQADGDIRRDPHDVHAAAAAGVEGASSTLPHLEEIQRAFGRHDVRNVRAQVGGRAAAATAAMGAKAFARGETVAFATTPDLRQAAHEAAHVIQQRAGVSLAGGVGRAGDRYEQHADAVAARVVRGLSAEALLDTIAGGGGSRTAVQRDGDEDDERLEAPGDLERALRRAAALRRARRAEAHERVLEPRDGAAIGAEMAARRRAHEDEAHERVAVPGDAEEFSERVRASREEPPLHEPDERMERVVRDGDADEFLERVRARRDEPMSPPDADASELELDYRASRTDPDHEPARRDEPMSTPDADASELELDYRADRTDPEGAARRSERRRREATERLVEPGDHERLVGAIRARDRSRMTDRERSEAAWRRPGSREDIRDGAAIDGMTRITTDDPRSGDVSHDGVDVRPVEGGEVHARISDRGAGGGVTAGRTDGTRGRIIARGETTEDGGTRGSVDVRGTRRVGGHDAHGEVGGSVERGRDGEVRGASARLGGGYRGGSATASAGFRCFAEHPVQDPAERTRFNVAWTASISRELGLEVFGTGGRVSDELERTGTEVFRATGGTEPEIQAAQQRAETWRDGFQRRSRDEVIAMFRSWSIGHDTDLAFWNEAEIGTRRSVRVRNQVSASLTLPILRLFELGASYESRWLDTALIVKLDDTHVDVTQTAEVRHGSAVTGGTFGTDVTGGDSVVGTARVVTRVELAAGGEALSAMLADGADLEENAPAVVVRERTRTEGRTSTSSSGFGTLGVDDNETLSHETGMRIDEATGLLVPVDVYHGEDVETTTGGFLFDTTGTFQVDAPAAGNDSFVIRHAITGRDGRAVRRELADALGTPDSAERGHSAHGGTWNIVEEFSQAEIATFCTGYVAHFEELETSRGRDAGHLERVGDPVSLFGLEVLGGSAYDQLYHRLRDLRGASSEGAQRIRAQAIAAFLCSTGEEGVRVIRSGAGASAHVTLTRTDARGAADTNFMSVTERRALETQITGWTALADSGETGGTDAAVADIDRALVAMRDRRTHVDDHEGYAALPLAAREDLVAGYALYISQLEALVTRLRRGQDESIASAYGTETQEEYRAMEAVRIRSVNLRQETQSLRELTIDHRRYFGQETSEDWRARLGASARARTNRLYRQAEANRTAAEEHVAGAERVLADSRLSPTSGELRFEETMSTLYHRARDRFTEATEAYDRCVARLRELNELYVELSVSTHIVDEDTAEPDEDATSATGSEDAERAPRRRERRGATGGATRTTEELRAVIEQAPLRALVAVNGIAVTVRHAEVAMNAGLRVRVVRHQVPATTEEGIAANGGVPVIFGLEITHAATGFDSFLAPMFGTVTDAETGMIRQVHTWDRVVNQTGVAFEVLTFVAV